MTIHSALFTLLLGFLLPSGQTAGTSPAAAPPMAHPRNIILMIGDGMGITQISAGMYVNDNRTHLEQFPIAGLHKALPADGLIADSAAGATAIACGIRTYNRAIGVNSDSMPALSILEEAESRGLATGLATSSAITHATPAAFIAHVRFSNEEEAIAADFLKTDIDLFIGGGRNAFNRRKSDSRDLVLELEEKGYFVSDHQQQALSSIVPVAQKNFAYFTADEEPLPAYKGRDYLPLATNIATYFLNNHSPEKGFFLMVEGGQIGKGGQENNSDYVVTEMIDFDKAIGEALKFAERDGQTLVIVTATNEIGGYAINPGSRIDSLIPEFTTQQPTASLIPVFAYGPGAELFRGIYDNTDIYKKIRKAFGWTEPKR